MIRIYGLSRDEGAEDHIAAHGVRPEEVEQAVEGYLSVRRCGEYFIFIGQTHSGRYFTVVLDREGEGIWYPVTARQSTQPERRMIRR